MNEPFVMPMQCTMPVTNAINAWKATHDCELSDAQALDEFVITHWATVTDKGELTAHLIDDRDRWHDQASACLLNWDHEHKRATRLITTLHDIHNSLLEMRARGSIIASDLDAAIALAAAAHNPSQRP